MKVFPHIPNIPAFTQNYHIFAICLYFNFRHILDISIFYIFSYFHILYILNILSFPSLIKHFPKTRGAPTICIYFISRNIFFISCYISSFHMSIILNSICFIFPCFFICKYIHIHIHVYISFLYILYFYMFLSL